MFSRSGLGRSGMTETGKFFSPRNGIALVELWRAINDVEDESDTAGAAFRLHGHPTASLDALSVEREAASECAEPNVLHRAGVFRVERLRPVRPQGECHCPGE